MYASSYKPYFGFLSLRSHIAYSIRTLSSAHIDYIALYSLSGWLMNGIAVVSPNKCKPALASQTALRLLVPPTPIIHKLAEAYSENVVPPLAWSYGELC